MTKPIAEAKVDLRWSEYIGGIIWHLFHGPMKYIFVSWILIAVYIALDFTFADQSQGNPAALIFPAFVFLFFPGLIVWSARRQFKSINPEKLNYQWLFFTDSILAKSSVAEAKLEWQAFERVAESKKFFFFFVSKHMFHILPKRCFSSKGEIDSLLSLIKEKIGKAAMIR